MIAKRFGLINPTAVDSIEGEINNSHATRAAAITVSSKAKAIESRKVATSVKKKVVPVKKVAPQAKKPVMPAKKTADPVKKIVTPSYLDVIPYWFSPTIQFIDNKTEQKVFLYFPWIQSHGDALIDKIERKRFDIKPFSIVAGIAEHNVRRDVSRFVRESPDVFRKLVIRSLLPLKNKITGFLFTLDWPPVMRILGDVCRELEIPTILIPHESVFADRDRYYKDSVALASVPKTDYILCWGDLQKDIFEERGFSKERIIAVGAPKFDIYFDYQPLVSRSQFFNIYGLNKDKKTILFAAQPLDSQFDTRIARESQRQVITDLLKLCEEKDLQLIIRMPPSKDNILNRALFNLITDSGYASIDDANFYLVPPEEAIYHSDFVASINSTMLFEAVLMGRYAISTKYVDFQQIWENVGIPAVKNYEALNTLVNNMLMGNWEIDPKGIKWAANQFGVGEFDGLAGHRIEAMLHHYMELYSRNEFSYADDAVTKFLDKCKLDVVGIPSSKETLNTSQLYLKELLNVNTVIGGARRSLTDLSSVDLLFQWGITENNNKRHQRDIGKKLNKPIIIIEDGFIRSVDIGLSGTPTLSIITDDLTSYYDATRPSRLEKILVSTRELNDEEYQFSREAINRIVSERVSKYNHAKNWPVAIGREGVKKVLLIDQRFGDQSVASALADQSSFERMLCDAVTNNPDADIIIKQHPDAIKGGKSSYYSDERIREFKKVYGNDNIHTINVDINPYAILEAIDEVYVVSSGMGMEALMAGKIVHCYGAPYYSGWGLTKDQIVISRRNRNRRLEDVFYYSYIELSRYLNPKTKSLRNIHDVIDYVVDNRGW